MSQLMFQSYDMCISPHKEVINMSEFEHQKENIQPVKSGRNPHALKSVFGLHESTIVGADVDKTALNFMNQNREAMLKAVRFEWENKLRDCLSLAADDPLRIWLQYIQWIEDSYPSLGPDSKYTEVLEQCSRLFSSNEQHLQYYRNDARFIRKVWLRYADRSSSQASLDIYNFMFQRGIGLREAQYYLQWAQLLEDLGDSKAADQVLGQAIRNIPQLESDESLHSTNESLKKLKLYYNNFKFRIMKKVVEEQRRKQEEQQQNATIELERQRLQQQQQESIGVIQYGAQSASQQQFSQQQPQTRTAFGEIDPSARQAVGNTVVAPAQPRHTAIHGSAFSVRSSTGASSASRAAKKRTLTDMLASRSRTQGAHVDNDDNPFQPIVKKEPNRFAIFHDDTTGTATVDSRQMIFQQQQSHVQTFLPTQQESSKENQVSASAWHVHRVPDTVIAQQQQQGFVQQSTRPFQIYQDSSFGGAAQQQQLLFASSPTTSTAPSSSISSSAFSLGDFHQPFR